MLSDDIPGAPEVDPVTENKGLISEAMDVLTAREKEIFTSRRLTEDPGPLWRLAREYGISGERTRQIEMVALAKVEARAIALRPEKSENRSEGFARGITLAEHHSALSQSRFRQPNFRDRKPGGER